MNYTLHFIFYNLYFSLYTLHFILYSLYLIIYNIHFILYSLFIELYTLYFTFYNEHCTLYTLYFTLYIAIFKSSFTNEMSKNKVVIKLDLIELIWEYPIRSKLSSCGSPKWRLLLHGFSRSAVLRFAVQHQIVSLCPIPLFSKLGHF